MSEVFRNLKLEVKRDGLLKIGEDNLSPFNPVVCFLDDGCTGI